MQQKGDDDEDEAGGISIASGRTSISASIGTDGHVGSTVQPVVGLHIPFIGLVFGTWHRGGGGIAVAGVATLVYPRRRRGRSCVSQCMYIPLQEGYRIGCDQLRKLS